MDILLVISYSGDAPPWPTLAYALFEIPTAHWADRVGSRSVLTRIVLWWSSFTMATAGAFSYVSLLAVRFLFGIGEAGAWPNVEWRHPSQIEKKRWCEP